MFSLNKKKYDQLVKACDALQGLAGKNTILNVSLTPENLRIQSIDDKHHRTVLILLIHKSQFEEYEIPEVFDFGTTSELFISEKRKVNSVRYNFTKYTDNEFYGIFKIEYDLNVSIHNVLMKENAQLFVNAKPEDEYIASITLTTKSLLEQLKTFKDMSTDGLLTLTYTNGELIGSVSGSEPILLNKTENILAELYSITIDVELIYKTISKVKSLDKTVGLHLPKNPKRPIRISLGLSEFKECLNYYMSPFIPEIIN